MESMRWVGVDVHAIESVAAVLDQTTGEVSTHRIAGRPDEVLDWLATVAQPFRAVYEAGPTPPNQRGWLQQPETIRGLMNSNLNSPNGVT